MIFWVEVLTWNDLRILGEFTGGLCFRVYTPRLLQTYAPQDAQRKLGQ